MGSSLIFSPIYIPLDSEDAKILIGKRRGSSQAQNTQTGMYRRCTYLASTSKNLFPEVAELKLPIFQDKKEDCFDTDTHAQTQFRFFSQLWGATSTFEFDFHQVLLRLLLCYVLLVHQSYFRFKFLLVFSDYFPFWFLIGDLYLTQQKCNLRIPTKSYRINYRRRIFQNVTDGFHFTLKY